MIKYILFGIGFVFLFEGLIYFFFAKKINKFLHMLSSIDFNTIRTISTILILVGFCLIYFTFKVYDFK
ncbi:MAG: hypothetical protein CFH16_01207 [Alphaproteobacteria bacterium MarineAlpha5_Bin6]|nr:MAG: hypothetical protein CFH17_00984 [Alphaproteobacteria bacterium MarineAlpha5_Bin7]PPR53066.1 MAG: hypothetical protein CFH16_01207 [Alphaproteobacteria bacterium MarineAlpha5_Bin6]